MIGQLDRAVRFPIGMGLILPGERKSVEPQAALASADGFGANGRSGRLLGAPMRIFLILTVENLFCTPCAGPQNSQ